MSAYQEKTQFIYTDAADTMGTSNHYPAATGTVTTPTGHQQNGSSNSGNVQMRNSNNNKPSMNGDPSRSSSIIRQTPDRSSYQVYVGASAVGTGAAAGGGEPAEHPGRTQLARNYSRSEQCDCDSGGCGPLLANNLAYFGAVAWFIVTVNVKYLPDAPFPIIGNGLPTSQWLLNEEMAAIVPLLLWAVHFVRRFTEVLFVHKYTRRMSFGESLGASVYYWGFGFWVGYSANFHLGKMKYYSPALYILIPGIVLFLVGEIGNCMAHLAQRQMILKRNWHPVLANQQSQRILPSGILFRFVSCPNYTFEIVSWIGFMLAVFTLPALLFLIASTITLSIYGHKKHTAYKEIFNGEDGKEFYPTNRKALIPFIF